MTFLAGHIVGGGEFSLFDEPSLAIISETLKTNKMGTSLMFIANVHPMKWTLTYTSFCRPKCALVLYCTNPQGPFGSKCTNVHFEL